MVCTECGERVSFKPIDTEETVKVAGRTFVGAVRAERCPACKAELIDGADLEDFEAAVAAELAKDGPIAGEALKYMRKAGLGMKAADVARLLDVAPETFSRWETGERDIPRLSWATVAGLVLERYAGGRSLLERLETLAKPLPKPLAKVRVHRRRGVGAAE
jgi:DNA-binding transcriptional regulator YiaG